MPDLPLHHRLRLDIRTHGRRLTIVGKKDALVELEAAIQRLVEEEMKNSIDDQMTTGPCAIRILYTNYRGETCWRSIIFTRIYWGKSSWHPVDQWLIEGFDTEKKEHRTFALSGIEKVGWLDRPIMGKEPPETTFTHDLPNHLEGLLDRLRNCDGQKSEMAVIVWEKCQLLISEIERLRKLTESLADRIATQSELLSKRAEKEPS